MLNFGWIEWLICIWWMIDSLDETIIDDEASSRLQQLQRFFFKTQINIPNWDVILFFLGIFADKRTFHWAQKLWKLRNGNLLFFIILVPGDHFSLVSISVFCERGTLCVSKEPREYKGSSGFQWFQFYEIYKTASIWIHLRTAVSPDETIYSNTVWVVGWGR